MTIAPRLRARLGVAVRPHLRRCHAGRHAQEHAAHARVPKANANGSRARGASSKADGPKAPTRAEVARNRERQAEQAGAKAAERLAQQSGAAGWVAERASNWDLEGPDFGFLERTKYAWNPLMDYWFRMEIGGWEHIPPAPALLIGIHSGAPFVWDAWTVGM